MSFTELKFVTLNHDRPHHNPDVLAFLSFNRPSCANAFNKDFILDILRDLEIVRTKADACRALIVQGKGKHFCSGADLKWMKDSLTLSHEENLNEAKLISRLFEMFSSMPMPVISVIRGAAYGGALGMIAGSDIVLASSESEFCLSEVKIGLFPAVVLPYVAKKMNVSSLKRAALTGRKMSASEAKESGLVTEVFPDDELNTAIKNEIKLILAGSPEAQRSFKKIFPEVENKDYDAKDLENSMTRALGDIRKTPLAQEGMKAFLERKKTSWDIYSIETEQLIIRAISDEMNH